MRIALLLLALPACDRVFGLSGAHQSADAPPDLGSDYASAILADGPVAFWRFDADDTTVVSDESAAGANPATYRFDAHPTAIGPLIGEDNSAGLFDGTGDHADVGNRLGFEGTRPFSIEAWVFPSGAASYVGVVSKAEEIGAIHRGYHLFSDDSFVGLERSDGSAIQDVRTTGLVRKRWTYVVVTFDSASLRLYIDGSLVATTGNPVSMPATNRAFTIAARNGGAISAFPGMIDEIAVYDRPLDQAAIDHHRLAALGQ